MTREPDFVFNLQVPVNVPTQEEQDMIVPHMDPFLAKLIEKGHLSAEEAAAYVKFASELGSYLPFMLDAFVGSYRNNKNSNSVKQQLQKDAEDAKNVDSTKLIV